MGGKLFLLKLKSARSALQRRLSLLVATTSFTSGLIACLVAGSANVQGQRRAQRPRTAPAEQAKATPSAPSGSQNFDTIAAAASAARDADKIDEAIGLYRQAIGLHPQWAEGWWFLGTLYYDHDKYSD